jgi:multidrug efflux pump subunit AcrB
VSGDANTARGPIAWMARNHVASNLLMLALLLGGVLAFRSITQEVFPDIQRNSVTVSVQYRGASPEEVEQGVVLPVEDVVSGLPGVDEVNSVAREGGATITIELLDSADQIQVYQDIQSEIDRIRTFPDDAEEPEVSLDVRRREVVNVALYGPVEDTVLKELAERARDALLADEGITQVDIEGTRALEVGIEIPQANLRRYGLTLQQVADRIRRSAVEVPGGGIKTEGGEILVRLTERRNYGREFARLPIVTARDGTQVLLEDIATITDGLEERLSFSTYNQMPAVQLAVYRVGDQTPTGVTKAALARLDEFSATLPEGIETAVVRSMASIYDQRAQLLLRNGAIGLCLVLCLLGLFLELRLAFWVMMGIPISFLGSLILMPAAGLSINLITMFAFIVALGIVVDDAIVVGENIYRRHEEGMPLLQAAIAGAREVSMPVAFSILTNIVAFLPLLVMPGIMGRILGMLPIVIASVFLLSWLECLFVLPAHLGHHRDRPRHGFNKWLHAKQQAFSDRFLGWVRTRYTPFLARCLDHRYLVVCVALGLLAVTIGHIRSGRMGFDLFPRVESDYAFVEAALPFGSPIEKTEQLARRMAVAAREVAAEAGRPDLIEGIFASIGRGGTHAVSVRVFLVDPDIRKKIMSTQQFTERWRKEFGPVKGVEFVRFQSDRGGPGSGSALTIELSHSRVDTLEGAAADLAERLTAFPRVSDIDDGFQLGKEQLSFTVRPEGRALGLNASEIARQVRNAYEGGEVLRQQRGRNEMIVRVRLPEPERVSEGDLDSLILRTPTGGEAPLRDVVAVERGRAYTQITHRKGRRTMTVTADVRPRSAAGQVIAALNTDVLPDLLRRYPGLTYSYEGRQAEGRKSTGSLAQTIPMILIAIYVLLAIPFRSYVQPLIVMMSIPFGIVGAVAGHLIMGYGLSLMSIIGIVALSGVVVNDSLVFVDFANRRRRETQDVRQALLDSGAMRFRPILLTTLTTFGGLAPMIFETSRQARFLIPMALSLGYGLLFATMITLVLVPSLYAIVEDVIDRTRRGRNGTP